METEFVGWDNAINFFKKYTTSPEERYGTYLERLANNIIDEARNNIQNNQNISSGTLISSIRILENNKGRDILVGTDLPYAIHIEYGRGPVHANGKVLHWKDKQSGKDVFAYSVKATEPSPFFEPAAITELKKFPSVWAELENQYIKELMTA